MTRQLYLDMDGVLADFDKKRDFYFPHFKGRNQDQTTKEENIHFWKTIDSDFPDWFGSLEPMEDFEELWAFCESLKPIILTALPFTRRYETIQQKQAWLRHHCGPNVPVIACQRKHKADYAHDGILVDDAAANCLAFEKAGGISILHTSAKDTIMRLQEVL